MKQNWDGNWFPENGRVLQKLKEASTLARIDDILAAGAAVSKLDLRRYLASREVATPVDYDAIEGGVVDCAPAFAAALAVSDALFVPPGVWRIAAPIVLGYGQSLFGVGDASVIQAREAPWDPNALPAYPSTFDAVAVQDGYAAVRDLKIVGGASAVKLYGLAGPCVRNILENLTIWDAEIGITLDGYDNPDLALLLEPRRPHPDRPAAPARGADDGGVDRRHTQRQQVPRCPGLQPVGADDRLRLLPLHRPLQQQLSRLRGQSASQRRGLLPPGRHD